MENEIENILDELNNVHYFSGYNFQSLQRYKALRCIETNPLESIYYLIESHVPGLRMRTVLKYEKMLTSLIEKHFQSLNKNYVDFKCASSNTDIHINDILTKLKNLPSEWSLVQLTPQFNPLENIEIDNTKYYTNNIHISVFNCGKFFCEPFVITLNSPKDSITGNIINFTREMQAIITSNKEILSSSKNQKNFNNHLEKHSYITNRINLDNRMKKFISDVQNLWLKEWRCLFTGKFINSDIENEIINRIKEFFKLKLSPLKINDNILLIFKYFIKSLPYLNTSEKKEILKYLFPLKEHKIFFKEILDFVKQLYNELKLDKQKKHPIILIIDDSLDCFPWEMIDVLKNESVSRVPSFHLLYALFKEHENSISGGYKIINNIENGKFIINPDLDLQNMENRILSFLNYWIPNWKGLSGTKPSVDEFEKILTTSDIFVYCGHGSGIQFFSMNKIQKTRINAVCLLFGCSSTKLSKLGPQTEMYGTYQMYLIACSPCIIGMLWEVTDVDTDLLTAEFISNWIPTKAVNQWNNVDKTNWKKGEKVNFNLQRKVNDKNGKTNENDILKALNKAKNSSELSFFLTKVACVARGIPVKTNTK